MLQTGALPVSFERLAQTNVSATLGKDSLAGGEDRSADRPARRRALPDRLLPPAGGRRRHGPRDLRRVHVRGDPHPQRHAHAARLRRPDPHDRCRGRCERRHLRAHQGRGAGREVDPCRDRHRLPEGLPYDRRRERRHGDHGARAVRRRDGPGEGLRAHAAHRNGDVRAHGRRRHPRDARPARRLPLVRQPALHGRRGAGDREVAADRRQQPRPAPNLALDRDGGDRAQRARRRRQGPELRHRLQGRHADHLQDARGHADRPRFGSR